MPRGRKRLGSELGAEGSKGAIPVAPEASLGGKPLETSLVEFADGKAPELNATVKGLEPLAEQLTDTGKKILNVILTDFSGDPEIEGERDVFLKLRKACERAGMLEKRGDQCDFFKTLADPQFMNIVKTTGQGMIGIYIVPIVAKVIEQAMAGDKTSQKWALEITGILQGKYDFYLQRFSLTHNTLNAGNINFSGKTDEELSKLVEELTDAEVVNA